MTTDREQIIAAAEEAGIYRLYDGLSYGPSGLRSEQLERFYTIALEAGRQAEREEIASLIETTDLSALPKNMYKRWMTNILLTYINIIRARSTK